MKKLILLTLVVSCLVFGCKKDEEPYKLNATDITLKASETFQFIVSKGETQYEIWEFQISFSDVSIGEMDRHGVFTPRGYGKTVMTVKTETSILKCNITVKKPFDRD